MTVDIEDPRPRYARVADDLREAIQRGDYKVGDKLPSGRQLAEQYGLSHMTVKQALSVLRSEGLVASHQGVGAFVRQMPPVADRADRIDQLDTRVGALEARVQQLESHATQSSRAESR